MTMPPEPAGLHLPTGEMAYHFNRLIVPGYNIPPPPLAEQK